MIQDTHGKSWGLIAHRHFLQLQFRSTSILYANDRTQSTKYKAVPERDSLMLT